MKEKREEMKSKEEKMNPTQIEVDLHKEQSNNNQQTTYSANSFPTTLFRVSETHLTITNSKHRPTSFQVSRSLHRKHPDTIGCA